MASLIKFDAALSNRRVTKLCALLATVFFMLATQCFGQQSNSAYYEYDRLNRVTKVTYDGSGVSIIYTYDAAGNRTATTVVGSNPAPSLTSLSTSSAAAGSSGFTLGVNGTNLVNGATVFWNGSARQATYFGSYVTIELTNADLSTPGNFSVVVANPAPDTTQSNALTFRVSQSNGAMRIDSVTPSAGRTAGGQQIRLAGAFAGLSTVTVGGSSADWFYTNGNNDTNSITVTTPQHAAVGAVSIDLTPTSGSPYSKPNAFAYLPTTFADDPLVPHVTKAKAQHIIELRQAVDALRAVAGLPQAQWTNFTLTNFVTPIQAAHVGELRAYLEEAAVALGYARASYTDPDLGARSSVIRGVHIEELRLRIKAIAGT